MFLFLLLFHILLLTVRFKQVVVSTPHHCMRTQLHTERPLNWSEWVWQVSDDARGHVTHWRHGWSRASTTLSAADPSCFPDLHRLMIIDEVEVSIIPWQPLTITADMCSRTVSVGSVLGQTQHFLFSSAELLLSRFDPLHSEENTEKGNESEPADQCWCGWVCQVRTKWVWIQVQVLLSHGRASDLVSGLKTVCSNLKPVSDLIPNNSFCLRSLQLVLIWTNLRLKVYPHIT